MATVWPLNRAYQVDLVINYLNRKIVIIRFGDETHKDCQQTDRWILESNDETMKRNAAIFTVETKNVPELVARYNLSGPCTLVFFHDNSVRHRLSGVDIKHYQEERWRFVDVMKSICESKQIPLRGIHRT